MAVPFDPSKDTLVTKANLGTFKSELDKLHWYGTSAALNAAESSGLIPIGCVCHVTDDYEDKQFYTKAEVDQLISRLRTVEVNPSYSSIEEITNPQENVIYIIMDTTGATLYSEYMYYNGEFVLIATQQQSGAIYDSETQKLYI